MELKKYKLGDLCTFINGRAYLQPELQNSGKYKIVRVGNLSGGNNSWYYSDMELEPTKYCAKGDLLYAWACNFGPYIWKGDKTIYHYHIWKVINSEQIDKMYLYYLLKFMTNSFMGCVHGSTMLHITKENMESMEVRIHASIEEQRRIATILNKLDCKIELNRQINDNLEAMAKQLYDYWFVQFDFPNEEGKPYKSSGGAMVWNEKLKREIPSCFEVDNMGNLCNFRNGINYSKDEIGNDYQIVNVRNISSSRILLDGEDFDVITVPTSKAENYVLKPDDIIIARSGCPGSTRLLLLPANTLFCGFIICCSPHNSSMRNYLTYCLKQLEGTNATTSGGSILQNVSQDTLKGLQIIVPEKEIIDKFNKTIEFIFARMLNCLKESKTLTKQRDELLPLLMNGQASVNYTCWRN